MTTALLPLAQTNQSAAAVGSAARCPSFKSLHPKGCRPPPATRMLTCGNTLDSSLSVSLATDVNSPSKHCFSMPLFSLLLTRLHLVPLNHGYPSLQKAPNHFLNLITPSSFYENRQHIKPVFLGDQIQPQDHRERGISKQQVTFIHSTNVFWGLLCARG